MSIAVNIFLGSWTNSLFNLISYKLNILNIRPSRVDFEVDQVDFSLACVSGQVEIVRNYQYLLTLQVDF